MWGLILNWDALPDKDKEPKEYREKILNLQKLGLSVVTPYFLLQNQYLTTESKTRILNNLIIVLKHAKKNKGTSKNMVYEIEITSCKDLSGLIPDE